MPNKKKTMTRRFYSTTSAINYPKLLGLYGEAVSEAKRKLDEKPDLEEIYIVEVKNVIRRDSNRVSNEYNDLLSKMEELRKEIEEKKTTKYVVEDVVS